MSVRIASHAERLVLEQLALPGERWRGEQTLALATGLDFSTVRSALKALHRRGFVAKSIPLFRGLSEDSFEITAVGRRALADSRALGLS